MKLSILAGLRVGIALCLLSLSSIAQSPPATAIPDNGELAQILVEDQADRSPRDGKMPDSNRMAERDRTRRRGFPS